MICHFKNIYQEAFYRASKDLSNTKTIRTRNLGWKKISFTIEEETHPTLSLEPRVDPKFSGFDKTSLFKEFQSEIWEFRTKYAGLQVRLLAFWDKTHNKETLVIATHGFIKKVDKVPANEIDRGS